jgi:hypothetical protein
VSNNTSQDKERTMSARLPNLDAILKQHGIHRKFWPESRGMVELGQMPSKELWTRMNREANYEAARSEIAHELSQGTDCQFPPNDYEVPPGYPLYESLDPEDIVATTSGGCAV